MSLRVLELNDQGLSLSDGEQELVRSPAFVLAENGRLLFGEEAAGRSRINPVDCNNRFWYELNMDPLNRPLAHFRHHADIAHAHLQHLAQSGADGAGEDRASGGEVIVAVPPSFDREQLRVLAAILDHSDFTPLAMVDASVAQAAARAGEGPVVLLDMQLHQMLLSVIAVEDGMVLRRHRVRMPGLGWDHLGNALMQLLTDTFIRQSRFNPQHNAEWEQYLFNALPGWLQQEAGPDDTLSLEIDTGSSVYRAELTRTAIHARLRSDYERLLQHLEDLPEPVAGLLYTERCAGLPGFRSFLQSALPESLPAGEPLGRRQLVDNCLQAQDFLIAEPDALHYITALPQPGSTEPAVEVQSVPAPTDDEVPTHLLLAGQARPLGRGLLLCQSGRELCLLPVDAEVQGRLLGKILAADGQFHVQAENGALRLETDDNTQRAARAGDRLLVEDGSDAAMQLIRVHNG